MGGWVRGKGGVGLGRAGSGKGNVWLGRVG